MMLTFGVSRLIRRASVDIRVLFINCSGAYNDAQSKSWQASIDVVC